MNILYFFSALISKKNMNPEWAKLQIRLGNANLSKMNQGVHGLLDQQLLIQKKHLLKEPESYTKQSYLKGGLNKHLYLGFWPKRGGIWRTQQS
jgi:hypothetical protein